MVCASKNNIFLILKNLKKPAAIKKIAVNGIRYTENKEYLKNEDYILVDAEEDVDLTQQFKVMQAPTFVVVDKDGVHKYVNASNIKKYADNK